MEEYLSVWKNAFNFSGRARRKEYWMFTLVNVIITIVLGIAPILGVIYAILVLLPQISLGMRRLHDIDRSGLWMLLPAVFVPFVFLGELFLMIGLILCVLSCIILIYFSVLNGTTGPNRFGDDPKSNDGSLGTPGTVS